MNLRFMFFDTEKKEWFKPTYKPLNDLLITGNGDIYHVTEDEDKKPTLKMVTPLYKAVQYVGVRDENQAKYYVGSLVQYAKKIGVLTYMPNGLCLDFDGDMIEISEKELRATRCVGHIFQQ